MLSVPQLAGWLPYRVFLGPRAESCRGPNRTSPMTEFEAASVCLELASFVPLLCSSNQHSRLLSTSKSLFNVAPATQSSTSRRLFRGSQPGCVARSITVFIKATTTCLVAGLSFSCREHHRLSAFLSYTLLLLPLLLAASKHPCAPTTVSPTSNHRRQQVIIIPLSPQPPTATGTP